MTELRHAFRQLAKSPGYVAVAVLIVAIGIGAATAMFSTVNALVLRPIALPEPERLVVIYETNLPRNLPTFSVSIPNYVDWKNRSTSWESLAAVGSRAMNLTGGHEPELAQVLQLSADYLPTVGIPLVLGRGFRLEEDRPGQNHVAIITTRYWQQRFGGKSDVLGKTITLDGTPHTIIGVAAHSTLFEAWNNIMIPMAADLTQEDRSDHSIAVYGRLKPRVTFAQAEAEMKTVAAQILVDHPEAEQGWSTRLVPLADEMVGTGVRKGLYVLLGAVGVLLLIACANLSNLMLVRASARAHELAIRTALGASRWRIVRQLLTESLLVTLAGGAVGILLALWAVDALHRTPLPRAAEISLDLRVLVVALIASVLTGLIAGVGPAFRVSSLRPQEALKTRAPRSGHRSRLRDTMVVAQLALSLMLLIGAALLVRSFIRLMEVNPGFNPNNVLTVSLRPNSENPVGFYDQVIERVSALPGVTSAGLISRLPLSEWGTSLNVFPIGPAAIPNDSSIQADWRLVHGDYFSTMQIPLLRGQTLESLDPDDAAGSMVISPSLARALFGDVDPIGRQVNLGGGRPRPLTIVGIVGDVQSTGLKESPRPAYYLSIHRFIYGPQALVVRNDGNLAPLISALRETIKQIDPTVPMFQIQTMNELRAERVQQERLLIALFGTFAGAALVLAALGTYGVVAFTVHQRTPEIGIRLAIGAQRHDILRLVLGQGVRLAAVSIALGLLGAFAASRVMSAMLYNTSATDIVSYAAAAVALATAALLASFIPAHRATRVDPLIALRAE
jgi:putative ABC transport system permease protein